MKNIVIASDHAGFKLKESLKFYIESLGYTVEDLGCHTEDSVDYPDFAHTLAQKIQNHDADLGVLVCGSGIGISIAANRHKDVRAALCPTPEYAKLAREHNDANVICFGQRLVDEQMAKDSIKIFLETEFEAGRHTQRVKKIED